MFLFVDTRRREEEPDGRQPSWQPPPILLILLWWIRVVQLVGEKKLRNRIWWTIVAFAGLLALVTAGLAGARWAAVGSAEAKEVLTYAGIVYALFTAYALHRLG